MTALRATGTAPIIGYYPLIALLGEALEVACDSFSQEHGREPDFDILSFRGGFSTTTVVIEIFEES